MRKPEPTLCPHCGATVTRRLVDNYIPASALGRPPGAKGVEADYFQWDCPIHGAVSPVPDSREQAAYDEWVVWLKTLPETVGEFCIEETGVCDPYGNHLFGLPDKIVSDFPAWVREMWERVSYIE